MYFKQLKPLLARLRRIGTERDRAGNRKLFYDQYVGLILRALNEETPETPHFL
jgi:hypothetical protein